MNVTDKDEYDIGSLSDLIHIIQQAYTKVFRKKLFSALLIACGVFLTGFSAVIALENYFYSSSLIKSSLFLASIILALLLSFRRFKKFSTPTFSAFYQDFAKWSDLEPIKNAIDLDTYTRDAGLALRQAAISQNIKALSNQKIRHRLTSYLSARAEQRVLKNSVLSFSFVALLCLALSISLPDSLSRSLHFWKSYEQPNPYSYTIEPGNITLEQGSQLAPTISFSGNLPDKLRLAFKTTIEESYRTRPAKEIKGETATFSALSPSTNAAYYFVMDGFSSKIFQVDIQLLPRFTSLTLNVSPPSYTGLKSTVYSYPFSSIKAYRGSKLSLAGTANKDLNSLLLLQKTAGDSLPVNISDKRNFSTQITPLQQDTLSFVMKDLAGLKNSNPFEFIFSPMDDEFPFVQILQPQSSNLKMKNPTDLPVQFEASDDFGLTAATLRYELKRAFREDVEKGSKTLAVPKINGSESFLWKIPQLEPKPRDVLTYWIEVSDNDAYSHPKTTKSRTLSITFPSLANFLEQLNDKESGVKNTLDKVSDSFEEMKQEYDRFKEQLKENPRGDWEQRQSLEEVKQQQQEVEQKVKDLNKKFDEIRREMEESSVMSEQTLKAYSELQKMIEEIDNPELAKALEDLQKSMENLNQQQLRDALENFEFNEQQYQERIKRTLELFKKLKLNSDLDKLAAALEELAKHEGELAESNENSNKQTQKQKAIQKDTEKLGEQVQELSKNSPDDTKKKVEELQNETQKEVKDIQKNLQENLDALQQSGESPKSNETKKQQQQIQQQFKQMAEHVRSKQKALSRQQKQLNIAALQYILYSLINLSENQEDLTRDTELLTDRSQAFVQKARTQQSIQSRFGQISDSLFKVSSGIPNFSNRINERKNRIEQQLGSAVEQLSERDKSKSSFAERQSLGGINELASMITSLLDQIQNQKPGSGSGSGQMSMQQMIEQLNKMSGRQQLLNQQMQDFINDMQGERLSKDQMQRLNQMSRQQNQIRKQLEQLQNGGQLNGGDKVLSELERMSEQMEETINDLRGGQPDDLLIKRQQNILSRMLNAEKALQERGEEERREGTTAKDRPKVVPPHITLEELQKKIRAFLNDPNNTRFTEDYQNLIKQYFELLRKEQQQDVSDSF